MILEEIDQVVEPVTESVAMAPAVGIAVAGGPMITLPEEERPAAGGHGADSIRSGLSQAGPVAVAGLVVNGAAALLVVAVARLVTPQAYGAIAQLLGLFFILSMPGSAVLVGVVRRVTALQNAGRGHLVRAWVGKVHRIALAGIAVEVVVVLLLQGWIARQLSLPNSQGIVLILVAAGVWILLCVDRGLLQAHRSYRGLAGNLLIEGGVRSVVRARAGPRPPGCGRLRPRGLPRGGAGHHPRPLAGHQDLGPPAGAGGGGRRSRRPGPTPAWCGGSSWPTSRPRSSASPSSACSRTWT